MKRIVYILLIISLIFALVSCESDPVADLLNQLSAKEYSMVKLSVTTSLDGVKLTNTYKITGSLLTYSVEALSDFTLDGREEFKTVTSGEAFINGEGEITSLDGAALPESLPEYTVLLGKFNFKSANLKNISSTESSFSADVVDLSVFMTVELEASAGKIYVEYSSAGISAISISYLTKGANVTLNYEFI